MINLILLAALVAASVTARAQTLSWRALDGPYGGHVLSFVSAPNGDVYANMFREQTVLSTDDGQTWSSRSFGGNRVVVLVTVAGTALVYDYWEGGLYRDSTDSTEQTKLDLPGPMGLHPALQRSNGTVIIATGAGLYRSIDDARTWQPVGPGSTAFRFPAEGPQGLLFAVADTAGIFRSSDDGATWTQATSRWGRGVLSLITSTTGDIFIGTLGGVARSRDLAVTFEEFALSGINGRESGLTLLADGDLLAATWRGLYRIAPDGTSTAETTVHASNLMTVHRTAAGAVLLGYDGRGILRSYDQARTFRSVGLKNAWEVFDLEEGSNGEIYACVSSYYLGSDGDAVYRSIDRGLTWDDMNIGEKSAQIVVTQAGTLVTLGDGEAHRSSDDGLTWTSRLLAYPMSRLFETSGGSILAASYQGMFRSTDDGLSWERVSDTAGIRDIAQAPGGELVALGFTELHRSTDDGATWRAAPLSAPTAHFGFWIGIATPHDSTIVLISRNALPEVAHSSDAGETWDTAGYHCGYGYHWLYDERERGMFLVSECGIFMARDGGARWEKLSEKPRGGVGGEILAHSGGDIYFGTVGMFVAERPSGMTIGTGARLSHELTVLPNPAGDGTSVALDLAQHGPVVLTLHRADGSMVRELYRGSLDAGLHHIPVRDCLPAGTYVIVLESPSGTSSTRLVILR
jgi:photosystem II stability/assembly factor-like uncharacterized protein